MLTKNEARNLVTDIYHIGNESYMEFKLPGGYNYGSASLKMEEERSTRALVVSKFWYMMDDQPDVSKLQYIIIKIHGANGKIWSGGQRSEVAAIATIYSPQPNWWQWEILGASGDHVEIDPLCQQFAVSFLDKDNNAFLFTNKYLLQLSILDN